jgi:hypothetical protein
MVVLKVIVGCSIFVVTIWALWIFNSDVNNK